MKDSKDMKERLDTLIKSFFAPGIDELKNNKLEVTVNERTGNLELDIDFLSSDEVVQDQLNLAAKITTK